MPEKELIEKKSELLPKPTVGQRLKGAGNAIIEDLAKAYGGQRLLESPWLNLERQRLALHGLDQVNQQALTNEQIKNYQSIRKERENQEKVASTVIPLEQMFKGRNSYAAAKTFFEPMGLLDGNKLRWGLVATNKEYTQMMTRPETIAYFLNSTLMDAKENLEFNQAELDKLLKSSPVEMKSGEYNENHINQMIAREKAESKDGRSKTEEAYKRYKETIRKRDNLQNQLGIFQSKKKKEVDNKYELPEEMKNELPGILDAIKQIPKEQQAEATKEARNYLYTKFGDWRVIDKILPDPDKGSLSGSIQSIADALERGGER